MNPLSFLLSQGRRAIGVADDFIIRDLIRASRAAGPQVRKAAVAGSLPAKLNIIARTRPMQAAGALTAVGSTEVVRQALNQQSPAAPGNALDRFVSSIVPDSIERPLMNFAREQEKKGFGGALELATPFGFLAAPFIPSTNISPKTVTVPQQRISNLPPGYRESELAAGAAAEAFRPGAGFPGQQQKVSSDPRQRAQDQERSRAAQLAEQDPLFKKYQVADLTKAYNAASSPEEKEKIGLQIWATTNPELAKRVRPGQVGYQTSAAMRGSQVFGTDIPGVTQTVYGQASEAAGLPSNVQFPSAAQMPTTGFGLGVDAQQLGVSAPGQMPPSMIGTEVLKRGLQVPSSEDLTQTQLALLKRAFESRLK